MYARAQFIILHIDKEGSLNNDSKDLLHKSLDGRHMNQASNPNILSLENIKCWQQSGAQMMRATKDGRQTRSPSHERMTRENSIPNLVESFSAKWGFTVRQFSSSKIIGDDSSNVWSVYAHYSSEIIRNNPWKPGACKSIIITYS